jgi:predicted Zn-dependent protease with MMP-like domain
LVEHTAENRGVAGSIPALATPVDLDFDQLVADALDELPAPIRERMSNVELVVEDEPPPGANLLGLYQGVPLTRRGSGYAGALPDKITIYSGPLERYYGSDPASLASEVRRVVRHEIAHHFGISDERLVEIDRY